MSSKEQNIQDHTDFEKRPNKGMVVANEFDVYGDEESADSAYCDPHHPPITHCRSSCSQVPHHGVVESRGSYASRNCVSWRKSMRSTILTQSWPLSLRGRPDLVHSVRVRECRDGRRMPLSHCKYIDNLHISSFLTHDLGTWYHRYSNWICDRCLQATISTCPQYGGCRGDSCRTHRPRSTRRCTGHLHRLSLREPCSHRAHRFRHEYVSSPVDMC